MNVLVKTLANRLPHPWLLHLYVAREARRERAAASELARRTGIPPLDLNKLRPRKTSDTVFLLGSGSSINHMGADRWDLIAAHDSIGLNLWPIHPFVPTFYVCESLPQESEDAAHREMFLLFLSLMEKRAADYERTPKLVNNLVHGGDHLALHLPPQWAKGTQAVRNLMPIARSRAEFEAALDFAQRRQAFDPSGDSGELFKYNSNLVACLSLALRLGYRRIVLCGVDLGHQAYFYQHPELYPEYSHLEFAPREIPHLTMRRLPFLVPIDEVLIAMRDRIMSPRGVELYVEHTGSALWPRIPLFPEAVTTGQASAPALQGRT